jgi:Transposase, Mutator family
MTTRDIQAHLREVYGVNASRDLISKVTDVVADEVELWRNRPVDEMYPIVYVDGIRIQIRDKGTVTIKVAYLVIGIDVEGRKPPTPPPCPRTGQSTAPADPGPRPAPPITALHNTTHRLGITPHQRRGRVRAPGQVIRLKNLGPGGSGR